MHVFKKKKSKRNKDSHVKNFNRQNFSFINYDRSGGFTTIHSTHAAHFTRFQSTFLMTILTIFIYFSFSLVYNIILTEFNYDVLLDVSKLIDMSNRYTHQNYIFYSFETGHLNSLGGLLNKIKVLYYCL